MSGIANKITWDSTYQGTHYETLVEFGQRRVSDQIQSWLWRWFCDGNYHMTGGRSIHSPSKPSMLGYLYRMVPPSYVVFWFSFTPSTTSLYLYMSTIEFSHFFLGVTQRYAFHRLKVAASVGYLSPLQDVEIRRQRSKGTLAKGGYYRYKNRWCDV